MDNQRNTRIYDLFKLIVALILLALLIILLLNFRGASIAKNQNNLEGQGNAAVQAPTATATEAAAAALPEATASPTTAPAATTTPAPTATTMPTATQPAPSPTPTTAADTPTPTIAAESPTPTPAQANASGDCAAAIPSRLSVGMKARVISNLNFRSSPGIENNLLRVNPVGTQLEVISGPVCTPFGKGAYLWWEVRSADGATGWSAEGTLEGKSYFLEPMK